jgi:hypothetical protein
MMLLVASVLLVILGFLAWLLIAPIELHIDTRNDRYWITWRSIANIRFRMIEEVVVVQLRVFFWKKDFYPLDYRKPADPNRKDQPKARKKRKKRKVNWWRKMRRILNSFEVKVLRVNLDTDDFIWNSFLFPFFFFLNNEKRKLTINYRGEAEIVCIVENRPYRLLVAVLL